MKSMLNGRMVMGCADRRIIAVCTSWEDEENPNLVLNRLIDVTDARNVLPVCVTFDRSSLESRGKKASGSSCPRLISRI